MIIDDADRRSYCEPRLDFRPAESAGVMKLRTVLRWFLSLRREEIRLSDRFWHEIDPPLYRSFTLIDGRRSQPTGRLWRRRTVAGIWEYRQDPETYDEFLDRQW